MKKLLPLFLVLVGLSVLIASCGGGEPETITVTQEVTRIVEVMATPEGPEVEVPYLDEWMGSPHADAEAEAFVHWDEDGSIPPTCAKCHSTYGYQDFLGLDGSEYGVVDSDHELGSVVSCVACHNSATAVMDSVVMPSGLELTNVGDEARCMQCHQGRASTVQVNEAIEAAGVDEDAIGDSLSFINIHYFAAAATKYGTLAKGGYEYDGKTYDARFDHVEGFDSCLGCHNSHTLEVEVENCTACHSDVTAVEDVRDIRMPGSLVDYDGDGDMEEGIYYEIETLQGMLQEAMSAYSINVTGTGIVYGPDAYPYFFIDQNQDGELGDDEAAFDNQYAAWTPRLLKAAYNLQVSTKDPGGYAHGGKYIIELLYDSIEDLNTGIDLTNASRIDHGHFAGSEEAFRHWDEDGGVVAASCSKCHSADGLPLFLTEGVSISQPASNGLECSTCHSDLESFSLYEVTSVTFPSGATISAEEPTTELLCMNCHQGRSSSSSVDAALEGLPDNAPSENIRFINIHYFAAGATRYGSEVSGAYEYAGKEYAGYFEHVESFSQCADCHNAHALEVEQEGCITCHGDFEELTDIRMNTEDVDGDGEEEGVAGEIATFTERLYAAMQSYSAANSEPILYDTHSYPYFFIDTNGNGEADEGEVAYPNAYNVWTPDLLRAAYNYQYALKDPGAFAHNSTYVLQVLYDSIQDLGGDLSGLTRP